MASLGITASIQRACSCQHVTRKPSTGSKPARSLGMKNVVTPTVEGLNIADKEETSPFVTAGNGKVVKDEIQQSSSSVEPSETRFSDVRWKNGTWDLNMFVKQGRMDWDSVIVAGTKISSELTSRDYEFSYRVCLESVCIVSYNYGPRGARRVEIADIRVHTGLKLEPT